MGKCEIIHPLVHKSSGVWCRPYLMFVKLLGMSQMILPLNKGVLSYEAMFERVRSCGCGGV